MGKTGLKLGASNPMAGHFLSASSSHWRLAGCPIHLIIWALRSCVTLNKLLNLAVPGDENRRR